MRLFVTGGTGFIGRRVTARLAAQGHQLLVLSREARGQYAGESPAYCQGSLAEVDVWRPIFERFEPEGVVHLAWEGLPDYSYTQSQRNLEQGSRLFGLAVESGCRLLVATGSCWEYASRQGMLEEEDALCSDSPFPAAKNALRLMGEAIAGEHDTVFVWLRLFFVYGPGQRARSLLPHIVGSLRSGKAPTISNPRNMNDFIYVDDVANAVAAIVEGEPGHTVYNVGTGTPTEVGELVRLTCRIAGVDEVDVNPGATSESEEAFWADISRLRQEIDWQPRWRLEDGIRAVLSEDYT